MPTGTGKTLVEIMLLDHFLQADDPQGCAVVVVNVAALVRQQANYIRDVSTSRQLRVAELLGNSVEWTQEYWNEVRQNHVIVCTAEILRRALVDHAFLRLDGCKLLVFDEAHHALGDHPFVKILERVSDLTSKPRIVGLTACFLHGRLNKPEAKRQQLEDRFAGTIWVPAEADIQEHLPKFNFERLVANASVVSDPAFLQEAKVLLENILSDLPEDLKKMIMHHVDKSESVFNLLGREGAEFYFSHGVLPYVKRELEVKMKVFSKSQKSQRSKLQSKIAQLEEMHGACRGDLLKMLQGLPASRKVNASGKVNALVRRLKELLQLDALMRCIVFVAEVAPTYPLAELLNRRVKPGALPVSGRSSMSDSVREKNIERFRDEEGVWCLVATSSIEEGIDIPSCNVVVRFDEFHNVKSHVQGAGRCRGAGNGGLVIYFENDPEKEELRAQQVHEVAQRAVQEPVAAGPRPESESSVHPTTGAEINRSNCLSMLNNYMSSASSGKMTLDDAFRPDSSSIQECAVPTRDTYLTVSLQEVQQHSQLSWLPKERFAWVILTKLREQGFLSENHLPQNFSRSQWNVVTATDSDAARGKRHLRFNPKAIELLQACSTELQRRICKGLDESNSKGVLKECVDLLLGKPCSKDDIAYLEVPGSCGSGFQRRVCIRVHLDGHYCFSAGEASAKKAQAEQSAASKALEELRALLDSKPPEELAHPSKQEAAASSEEVAGGTDAQLWEIQGQASRQVPSPQAATQETIRLPISLHLGLLGGHLLP